MPPDSTPPEPSSAAPARRPGSVVRRPIRRVTLGDGGASGRTTRDSVVVEEPLEIRVLAGEAPALRVSVTMRTPGADFELAAGFLFGEGLVDGAEEIAAIRYCVDRGRDGAQLFNVVNVHLRREARFDPALLQRNFYMTSSCGVCGKASIDAVLTPACQRVESDLRIDAEALLSLPERLRGSQAIFERTGGLHAAALFDARGEVLRVREDVGRHNALDKLIGASLLAGDLPLRERVVVVSGRLSFELVQKAVRAGAAVLAGVSAPSSLAVDLASRSGLTLVGFLRERTFNVYAGAERVSAAGPGVGGS